MLLRTQERTKMLLRTQERIIREISFVRAIPASLSSNLRVYRETCVFTVKSASLS